MEIRHRQQLGLAGGQPFGAGGALALGTVAVAARVVGDPDQAAIGAALGMAAEPGGAAGFDCRHDAALDPAEMAGMVSTIGLAMAAA